ncbi:MAG: histidine kinase [Lachnospiraceae bacterium]|nr:histidine kinase [Lachnospiraceae bacterium]
MLQWKRSHLELLKDMINDMTDITKNLCKKYTDLSDDEINCVAEHAGRLQSLADAAQADAFIDCRTSTGKTAIVVGEAKPKTVPSNYTVNIIGMLMNWCDEPAMDRTFRLGIPTSEMRVINAVENRKVVQTTEPIFFDGRVVAVLIYEKKAEEKNFSSIDNKTSYPNPCDINYFGDYLDEAVVLIGQDLRVAGRNRAAAALYSELGYIDDITGMEMSNIQFDSRRYPESIEDISPETHSVSVSGHRLIYKIIPIKDNQIIYAIIIRDVTELSEIKKQSLIKDVALRELRHRINNSLHMFADTMRYQEKFMEEVKAKETILNTAGRLEALASSLEEIIHVSCETVSLKFALERLKLIITQNSFEKISNIDFKVCGDDVEVSAGTASSVALVVYELVQNAINHAFSGKEKGTITVSIKNDYLFTALSVEDDGCGFDKNSRRDGAMGLDLVDTIVREKLSGKLDIVSGEKGTKVFFDFYE